MFGEGMVREKMKEGRRPSIALSFSIQCYQSLPSLSIWMGVHKTGGFSKFVKSIDPRVDHKPKLNPKPGKQIAKQQWPITARNRALE